MWYQARTRTGVPPLPLPHPSPLRHNMLWTGYTADSTYLVAMKEDCLVGDLVELPKWLNSVSGTKKKCKK